MFRTFITACASALAVAFVLSASPAIAQTTKTDQKVVLVDLNTADLKTITAVPGVGDTLAAAIIKARPFKSVDDLKNVKGIGPGPKFDSLKKYFTVAKSAAAKSASGSNLAPGEKININTASEADLIRLPEIGKTKAKAIIDYRTKHGPFAKIDDIKKVDGIKESVFATIKNSIVVK